MSKRKPILRPQKHTIFAFGEGENERVFLKHLRALYSPAKTSVTVHDAGGKDPGYILTKAIRIREEKRYDYSFLLLDTDIEWDDSFIAKAKREGFELIGSCPCVEGMFLSILFPRVNHTNRSSLDCKRQFQKEHLKSRQVITDIECGKLFPKDVLERAKSKISQLKRLIDIMSGLT